VEKSEFFKKVVIIGGFLMSMVSPFTFAEESDAQYKVVIQVSTDDKRTQTIAVNNAVNIQKHYGIDNVDVEVVAYGPGLGMLTKKSTMLKRIESLALSNVKFSACKNTMTKIKHKKGKTPTLAKGVKIVPAGVSRIIELQQAGYAYIRP